jgi:hypothetical protein
VTLIRGGRYGECLASARSAREYDVPVNSAVERAESLDMAAGDLAAERIPEALGTGVLISNLWYCNYSDRNHCRITGMTRYACLWVENGQPVAPVNVMRFDESLFHILGDRLEAITREREHILDNATYERRCHTSAACPACWWTASPSLCRSALSGAFLRLTSEPVLSPQPFSKKLGFPEPGFSNALSRARIGFPSHRVTTTCQRGSAMTDNTFHPRLRQLETMLLIRAYEEQLVELQRNGAPGTCTSVGQEACAVGVVAALEARDLILTNHRSAAHLIARGADPGRLIAEVLGRVDGYCGGRSGSLHISARRSWAWC